MTTDHIELTAELVFTNNANAVKSMIKDIVAQKTHIVMRMEKLTLGERALMPPIIVHLDWLQQRHRKTLREIEEQIATLIKTAT